MDVYNLWSIYDASLGLISFGIGWYVIHKVALQGRGVSWREASLRVRDKMLTFVDKFGEVQEVIDDVVGRSQQRLPTQKNIVGWLPILPEELKSEAAQWFSLKALLSLALTDRATYHAIWGNKQVWYLQHIVRHIGFSADLGESIDCIRDTFRKSLFDIDLPTLQLLKCAKPQDLMSAVTKTLSGMMLQDGMKMKNLVYDLIMKALREYQPSASGAQVNADSLMCVIRSRNDLFCHAEIEAFEDAFNDAQQLDNLMEGAATNHLHSLLRSLGVSEPAPSRSTKGQNWDLACSLLAESFRSSQE